jgi:hypothetical protein
MKDEECMFRDCLKGGLSFGCPFVRLHKFMSCNILPTLDVGKK